MLSVRLLMILLVGMASLTLVALILGFPQESLEAALRGMIIWWDVLFPALFPFFVISEMMLGFGIVHFIGTLLDPMMRPLFRVPGIGGFVMAMGFASGYPVGARLTSQLWEQQLVNREEGERLVAFATTSDPIFLIGAVAIGFFHNASLAVLLAVSHYGAAVIVGLIMRYHGDKHAVTASPVLLHGFVLFRAFESMHQARISDGRSVGLLLQQAVQSSLRLVFIIGGLVVFFSVVLELFTLSHIMDAFFWIVQTALHVLNIPKELSQAVVNGFFEVTIGVKSAVLAGSSLPMANKVAVAAFVLSWAGLSVHAQIVSLLQHTNLRYRPFLLARLLHGIVSALLVYVLWKPLMPLQASFSTFWTGLEGSLNIISRLKWTMPLSGIVFFSVFGAILILFIIYLAVKSIGGILGKINVRL